MESLEDMGLIETHDLDDVVEFEIERMEKVEEFHGELEHVEFILENLFTSLCVTHRDISGSWSWAEEGKSATVEYSVEIQGRAFKFVDTVECRVGAVLPSALMLEHASHVLTQLGHPMNLYYIWPADAEPNIDEASEVFHRFVADMEAQRLQGRLHYARIDDRIVYRAERR